MIKKCITLKQLTYNVNKFKVLLLMIDKGENNQLIQKSVEKLYHRNIYQSSINWLRKKIIQCHNVDNANIIDMLRNHRLKQFPKLDLSPRGLASQELKRLYILSKYHPKQMTKYDKVEVPKIIKLLW